MRRSAATRLVLTSLSIDKNVKEALCLGMTDAPDGSMSKNA